MLFESLLTHIDREIKREVHERLHEVAVDVELNKATVGAVIENSTQIERLVEQAIAIRELLVGSSPLKSAFTDERLGRWIESQIIQPAKPLTRGVTDRKPVIVSSSEGKLLEFRDFTDIQSKLVWAIFAINENRTNYTNPKNRDIVMNAFKDGLMAASDAERGEVFIKYSKPFQGNRDNLGNKLIKAIKMDPIELPQGVRSFTEWFRTQDEYKPWDEEIIHKVIGRRIPFQDLSNPNGVSLGPFKQIYDEIKKANNPGNQHL